MRLLTGSLRADPLTPSFQSTDVAALADVRAGDRIRITQGPFRGQFGRLCEIEDLLCLVRLTEMSDGTYVRIPTDQVVAVED
ncbi:MAG TPA: hypothetical protein VMP01_10035 [Pirellulaceae bacterium]|nr:hypothetical protein [Pirellulaceae bacterium]